jgi:AcrR family transcriptional regulator
METPFLPFFVSELDSPAKRAILMAALRLFAARGVDGVTIRDIAAEAHFTNPALFKHFASKEALARALFEACYRRLAMALTAPVGRGEATLRDRFAAALAVIEQSPESIHFVLENLRRYWPGLPEDARGAALPASVRRLIEAEQKAGRLRAGLDPRLATVVMLGALAQVARMAQFGELPRPPSAMAGELWDLLLHGLGA